MLSKYLGYLFFRIIIWIFDLIPFWILYKFSDILYILLYYIIGYRKKVVRNNLSTAYPEWDLEKIKLIEKKFYKHLADIFLEGIKAVNLSDSETVKRYKILTLDAPNQPFKEGKASLFVGSHINNWEYGALGCGLQVDPLVIVFYKPIKNDLINEYIRHSRKEKGTIMAPLRETSAHFENYLSKHPMFIMIADQSPSNVKDAYWTNFFGQETAVLHGPAKYALKYNLPIYIFKTIKAKRGFYELKGELLIDDPSKYSGEEITRIYTNRIEAIIREAPEYWLWSHKRWKKKRSELENQI
jgi:KDO2-lipid IV(A) lauroyltransferase